MYKTPTFGSVFDVKQILVEVNDIRVLALNDVNKKVKKRGLTILRLRVLQLLHISASSILDIVHYDTEALLQISNDQHITHLHKEVKLKAN